MEAPGLSLFQGSDSIQLDASNQRSEEDEEQEDFKRRNEEIKDLLTNAFDDLEDDDTSSLVSSHHDSLREPDCQNVMTNSYDQNDQRSNSPRLGRRLYDCVDNSINRNHTMTNHQHSPESGPTISDIQKEFGLYDQPVTPFKQKSSFNDNESSYELTRMPHPGVPNDVNSFPEQYPYNYNTPVNRYDIQMKRYQSNGYMDGYEHSVHGKQNIYEFGGGDNTTSDHMNHCCKTNTNGRPVDDNTIYKTAEYNSKDQLEVLYMVRMKEIQRLTEELQQLHLEKEEEKCQLGRKSALLQAEVERSNISRNQAQHALVDAKAEIADLQSQITSLKEKNAILERTNQNIMEELKVARGSVIDLQQKIAVLERVQILQSNDKTHEKFLKQAQEKHAVEMRNMQTQIDLLTDKLNAKETSYVALEHKLADLRRAHESLMVEKGDAMNRLAQALDGSQAQCRNLMTSNNAQQIMQLQAQVKMLAQEKEEMHRTIQELQNKLEVVKSDVAQYDSLLTTTLEEESDSMKQMKLGELHNKSRSKPCDDVTNKLRVELQRCLAGQAVKRKEINRLENTLAQKDKELNKALTLAESCRHEAAHYAKRSNELEQELKSLLMEQAMKANAQIQKLSDHLNDVKKQYDLLREEKSSLEQKLQESQVMNKKMLKKMHQDSIEQQEKETVDEYNKEYLEIHAQAVERVRQETQVEIVQLTVQLEQTQKELNHVKELYIEVCSTKEQLVNEHKNEITSLKEKYNNLEEREKELDKLNCSLQAQSKLSEKLIKDCESYKNKIMELEKNLKYERRKKEEHTKKIHREIEKAKEEALNELRNAHPNKQISILLPDHCAEHLEKIGRLEEDCKNLEEKLQAALVDHKSIVNYQNDLDDTRLKLAQMEICQESWKKKYDNAIGERNNLLKKIAKLENDIIKLKIGNSEVANSKTDAQVETESLKEKYDSLLSERDACKNRIVQLETELSEMKRSFMGLENGLRKNSKEEDIVTYKDIISQLKKKLIGLKEGKKNDMKLEQRIKQLEKDLQAKDERLFGLKDFERIKSERDELILKLKNHAKQFEEYVKNQKQVSAELNMSPNNSCETADFRKIKETMVQGVREELEHKVIEELRHIEERNKIKRREIDEKYNKIILELQSRLDEKNQEVDNLKQAMLSETMKIQSSFKAKEKFVTQVIETKLETYHREILTRNSRIEKLEEELKQKENEVEEERNVMAQVMTKWAAEIREMKNKEIELNEEIRKLKEADETFVNEVKNLQEREKEMKNHLEIWKHKYQAAKKTAHNYKEHAENKEKFLLGECQRIEKGYKRAFSQVQQKFEALLSNRDEKIATQIQEFESQYDEQLEQLRLKMKYKSES